MRFLAALVAALVLFSAPAFADPPSSKNDGKIQYHSPRFSGFTVGLSFGSTLNEAYSDAGSIRYNNNDFHGGMLGANSIDAGGNLRYEDSFSFPNHGEVPFFLNYDITGNFNDKSRDPFARLHLGTGNDSGFRYDTSWTMRLGGGVQAASLQDVDIYGVGGMQITDECLSAFTDETSGGGVMNRFRNGGVNFGAYFGAEVRTPLNNIIDVGSGAFNRGYVSFSATGVYLPGSEWTGQSTLGNNYRFTVDDRVVPNLRLGVNVPVDGMYDTIRHNF